jgi:hypothetical protein
VRDVSALQGWARIRRVHNSNAGVQTAKGRIYTLDAVVGGWNTCASVAGASCKGAAPGTLEDVFQYTESGRVQGWTRWGCA